MSEEDNHNKREAKEAEAGEQQPTKLPYPKQVFFIIGNEFCERFSYYGMKGNKKYFSFFFSFSNVILFFSRTFNLFEVKITL